MKQKAKSLLACLREFRRSVGQTLIQGMDQRLRFVLSIPNLCFEGLRTLSLSNSDIGSQSLNVYSGYFDATEISMLRSEIKSLSHFDFYLRWLFLDPAMKIGGGFTGRAWEYAKFVNYFGALAPKTRVLDIGAGNSTFACYLARMGQQVVTIDLPDPSARSLSWARYKYGKYKVRRDNGTVFALPYADCSFDIVTCISVIEHFHMKKTDAEYELETVEAFKESIQTALAEASRVSVPGGYFYLTTDVYLPGKEEQTTDLQVEDAFSVRQIQELLIPAFTESGFALVQPGDFSADWLAQDLGKSGLPTSEQRPMSILARKLA